MKTVYNILEILMVGIIGLILIVITLAITIGPIFGVLWLLYKLFVGIFYLLDKLIDKI